MAKITVQNTNISIISVNGNDYISLTDLARHKSDDPNAVIANWLRNRNTIEYLGIWEQLYNPNFKPTEFEGFRRQAGLNAFTLSPKKWTDTTELICLSNMENLNAVFIEQGMAQSERLVKLNKIAIHQMSVLESGDNDRKLLK